MAYNLDELPLGSTFKTMGPTYPSFSVLINIILKNALTLAGIIFLGLLIFGGITFIMNAGNGDSKKAEQSKAAITNAAIGFAIVILAYSIIKIIEAITGLSILNPNSNL